MLDQLVYLLNWITLQTPVQIYCGDTSITPTKSVKTLINCFILLIQGKHPFTIKIKENIIDVYSFHDVVRIDANVNKPLNQDLILIYKMLEEVLFALLQPTIFTDVSFKKTDDEVWTSYLQKQHNYKYCYVVNELKSCY